MRKTKVFSGSSHPELASVWNIFYIIIYKDITEINNNTNNINIYILFIYIYNNIWIIL